MSDKVPSVDEKVDEAAQPVPQVPEPPASAAETARPVSRPNPPPPSPTLRSEYRYQSKIVQLSEEFYGTHTDTLGRTRYIKKFTWRNYNKVSVSVVNYGARIVAIKAPDRNGHVVDVLLGYDNLEGQTTNLDFPFGGCLGKCANFVDQRIIPSDDLAERLDRVVWTPYIDGSKVVMTYASDSKEEGRGGQIFARVIFDIRKKNRFHIDYEFQTTEPTTVNLTHLCYFNLAGCDKGEKEIANHILTVNANCYTVQDERGSPTGEIKNVVNTKLDFQIPKCLAKVIGEKPEEGIEQNYCVNGVDDNNQCLLGRLFHPPSGRMIEVFSTQKGAFVSTGNNFGSRHRGSDSLDSSSDNSFVKKLRDVLLEEASYTDIRNLIELIKRVRVNQGLVSDLDLSDQQKEYLVTIYKYCKEYGNTTKQCQRTMTAIESILKEIPNLTETDKQSEQSISCHCTDSWNCSSTNRCNKTENLVGKFRCVYKPHSGIAITPGNYPNAAKIRHFPNVTLKPGEVYKQSTSFRFWIRAGNPNNWMKRRIYEMTHESKEADRLLDQAKAREILAAALLEEKS